MNLKKLLLPMLVALAVPVWGAVTTVNGVLAGMQPPIYFAKAITATLVGGRMWSTWALVGMPGAGAFDVTLNGAVLSSTSTIPAGALRHIDPGSGNSYLARFTFQAGQPGVGVLADRLWSNGGITITSTSAQTITSPTWPARDNACSTNGDGVMLALEVSNTTAAGTPTITVSYTNSAGTSGHTATNILATTATSQIGSFYQIALQSGDIGVRSVQSVTLSATWTSGTINLVAYRPLAALEVTAGFVGNSIDALTGGLPQLCNGVVPWVLFLPNTTTAINVSGTYVETQG